MQHKLIDGQKMTIVLRKDGSGDVDIVVNGMMIAWIAPSGRFMVRGYDLLPVAENNYRIPEIKLALQLGEVQS